VGHPPTTTHISIYVLLPSGENLAEKQPKKKTTSSKKTKRETKQNADLQQLRMITIFTPQMSFICPKTCFNI
jgi:hypothetical protein